MLIAPPGPRSSSPVPWRSLSTPEFVFTCPGPHFTRTCRSAQRACRAVQIGSADHRPRTRSATCRLPWRQAPTKHGVARAQSVVFTYSQARSPIHNTRLRQSMTGDPLQRIRSLERTTLKDPTGCRTGRPARHPRDRCRMPLPRRNRRRGRRPRSPSQAHETCEPGAQAYTR